MDAGKVFDAVRELMRKLPEVFLGVDVNYSFGEGRPFIGDWSVSGNEGILISGDGVGSKSGFYFFLFAKWRGFVYWQSCKIQFAQQGLGSCWNAKEA